MSAAQQSDRPTAYTGPFPIRGMTLEQVWRQEDLAARALPRARSMKPCYMCGMTGLLGCEHFRPWEPELHAPGCDPEQLERDQ
jgi:hypothetical protein